jgi:glycosyltransferase involved in cell wall biosynthesis
MRLAILTLQISPYHNARYVSAARHFDDVHVVSNLNAGDFTEFIAKDLGSYAVHRTFEGQEAYAAAAVSGELVRCVRERLAMIRPDAVAAAGWASPESFAALAYGREAGIPVIIMSESQGDDAARSFVREAIKKRVVSQFDAALVGGPPHADYVVRLGIPRQRIQYGYNAVDNAHFASGAAAARADASARRARHGLPERYVLASARFIAKKNLPALVTAYAAASKRATDVPDLVILGDGPERAAVEAAIADAGVEPHVHMPGFRGYAELPTFYGLSEGLAHVSTVEQWGLVVNEAMAAGVPVIVARNVGAGRTVVQDGVNGFLCDADVSSISEALAKLFALAPGARAMMGRAAAASIADWGPERFGAGMKAAVESALASPRRGAIAPWDREILKRLQSKIIDAVV